MCGGVEIRNCSVTVGSHLRNNSESSLWLLGMRTSAAWSGASATQHAKHGTPLKLQLKIGFSTQAVPSNLSNSVETDTMASEQDKTRALLINIYRKHCPQHIKDIPWLLNRFAGREQELVDAAQTKYGITQSEKVSAQQWPEHTHDHRISPGIESRGFNQPLYSPRQAAETADPENLQRTLFADLASVQSELESQLKATEAEICSTQDQLVTQNLTSAQENYPHILHSCEESRWVCRSCRNARIRKPSYEHIASSRRV